MTAYDFDLFTIGAGSGGVAASRRAGSYGARVAICEESRVGGTCVIRGCVPKKLLVYGSRFRDELDDAAGFGWTLPEAPSHDWGRLVAAKDREVDRLNGIYIRLLRDSGVTLLEGRARLVDGHTVAIGDRTYTAKHVLIATGSRPVLPPVRGIEHAITSNEALDLPALPRRVAIVGGGYIGVEFAGIFGTLGSQVTMIIRGETVLRGFDDDLRANLTAEMRKRGIRICCETNVEDIERRGDTLSVMTREGDTLEADVVLYATGRSPNTRGLGLVEAGVALDAAGAVVVDRMSRTAVESVYAVGDCTNRVNLTPVAITEGRAVAETLFHDNPIEVDHEYIASAVFSQPPLGTVGYGEREARQRFGKIDVYASSFRPMKNNLTGRDERTVMKLVVERATQRVVGCHMLGPDAPEIIQGFAVAVKCGATKAQFDATVGIHPTAAEELVTMREKRPDPTLSDD
jgi:glutathione reductase (NADPH)